MSGFGSSVIFKSNSTGLLLELSFYTSDQKSYRKIWHTYFSALIDQNAMQSQCIRMTEHSFYKIAEELYLNAHSVLKVTNSHSFSGILGKLKHIMQL